MMALIGFICLIFGGIALLGYGLIVLYTGYLFGGGIWPIALVMILAGSGILWLALGHMPFEITWRAR